MDLEGFSDWTFSAALARRVSECPERTFLALSDGTTVTYGGLDAAAARTAAGLAARGLGRGDRLLLMARNSVAFVVSLAACARVGAVLVPVNTAYTGDWLAAICADSGAGLMVLDAGFVPALAEVAPGLPELRGCFAIGGAGGFEPFEGLGEGLPPHGPVPLTAADPAAILYTSGTTGRSKGVIARHGQLHLNAAVFHEQMQVGPDDVIYCCLPMFHLNALTLQLYCGLLAGCRVVLAERFSARNWLAEIRAAGATLTNLLGSMPEFLLATPEAADDADNPLRAICMVPIQPQIGPRFAARFAAELVELYGMTEIDCPLYMPRGVLRPGSCGRLLERWFDARIVDPATDIELPAGEVGELVVRPRLPWTTMAGYHGLPEETVRAWRNLWFHTGDAMRRDDEGYFSFVDRLKDCVRRSGENVSSFEIERVLLAADGVGAAAVVGLPAGAAEQEILAVVVPAPGKTVDCSELAAHCRARLPRFAVPTWIEIADALPRTPTEKVRKQELRQRGVGASAWRVPARG